ncbi:MAG: transglycosylase SLT domain-containing protein [Rhodanobacteraceae bacterium]
MFARPGALALAAALLAACSVQPQRPTPAPPLAPPPPPVAPAPPVATAPEVPSIEPGSEIASPWPRLRSRFAMTTCDYRPQVIRWAKRYTASPRRFAAGWENAMPFLLIVVDEIERRNLPGEFAMLPYVESSYEPVASRGDRPAGMWQLVPRTARAEGVMIDADYDGRLDAAASTTAALALIDRYQKEFGDWRLADMAFNSGEYRVKNLLRGRDAHSLTAAELGKLSFNPITHDHLDRLLALACVISDPARFNVTLPEPTQADRLETVELEAGMDVRLAARLAGLDAAEMRRYNAGYRRNRMPAGGPHRLMIPANRVAEFETAALAVPVAYWNEWREQRAARTSGIGSFAAEVGVPVTVLALANGVGEETTVLPSTQLLLPGRDPAIDTSSSAPDELERSRVHVVKSGDSLSSIAHRYEIPLTQLKRLNPSAKGLLHPGDRVQVGAADTD